ncbi:MAG: FAD-dependent oxidoreductase [Planctomycetota bacterium]
MSDRNGGSVCVVGGGIVGAMSAWYLADAGVQVTLVERDRFGAACSRGNCGYVAPSHVLPLCQPGAIRGSLKTLFERNSAFAIKPRASLRMLRWLYGFSRRCNERDMLRTAEALRGLLFSSKDLYLELVREEGVECDWQERGLLNVYAEERGLEAFRPKERMLRERFGVGATFLDREALLALEPALKDNVAGAWHFEMDAHLRPDLLMESLRPRLEARGVRIVEGATVARFRGEAGAARAIELESGDSIEAEHFVVATGAWTPFLERDLGLQIPIEPGKGYSITTSAPERMPTHPLILEESHVAITPMTGAYRIGSTMEFVGYDESIDERRLQILTDAARKHLVDPIGGEVRETWWGWRPMVWDGRPIIDRAPALGNVVIAAGHSMIGISMGPATGRLVAELVTGADPHVDPAPFGVARFG